ncbi:MAG TPA: ABC transporter ATP-binding protein [Candidatus Cloacimonadota bacterium]|nr:ABC transporter ATP-binding protein [Candidatus Cloacimonadota bacterium]HPB08929.1 ABC transporter ATP-binding protein [Candidatus Cloacimonadota bacterium]HQO44566.1 ABC transporter ATP-binding protein [Candidatus Cloacimonadota bacterium]HQP17671.1 ABC transporter ATP-binding protein [Candidatus Cloacimonadota bacterium]HRS50469.1 ABC transporter ATP-binding protein [Candidatus Cloacimonadota bacterium]
MNKHVRWIVKNWMTQKWFLLIMLLFTLGSSAVAIAHPIVFGRLIDLLKSILSAPDKYPDPMAEVNRIIWIMLGLGAAQLVTGFYPAVRGWVNIRFENMLRMFYFKFILGKDFRFFHKFRTGDVVTRLTDDLTDYSKISWFMCSGIFRAVNSFSLIMFSLVVMFSISPKLTLLTILPLPLMMVAFYFASDKLYRNFELNQQAISEINSQLEMSFSGIRIVKAFVSEEKYNRFFDLALARRFKTEMGVVKLNAVLHLIYEYIDYFAQIGVIIFGGYMAVKGQISVGTFYMFYTYLSMMIYPLLDLPQLFVSGKQAFVNIDRLEEMKDYPSFYDQWKGQAKPEEFEELRFEDVSFTYPDKTEPAIRDCSFDLKAGERLLILGSTGAGKSTVANLILGLLQPSEGSILLNGIDLRDIDLTALRDLIAYVPQEPLLFTGTVRENVLFANDKATGEEYRIAVDVSQLKQEIESFPQGDETRLGQRGLGVSGGQKQRLTIARALVRNPKLLILDDITASLDAENEEKLWQDINLHFKDIAAIVISHRLSTLHYVDRVLFIDDKGYVHQGTHEELVFKNKDYHDFLHEHLK